MNTSFYEQQFADAEDLLARAYASVNGDIRERVMRLSISDEDDRSRTLISVLELCNWGERAMSALALCLQLGWFFMKRDFGTTEDLFIGPAGFDHIRQSAQCRT